MPLAFSLASSNVLVYSWIVRGPGATTFSLWTLGLGSIIMCLADLSERINLTLDDPRNLRSRCSVTLI
jgi:hypothetical protein